MFNKCNPNEFSFFNNIKPMFLMCFLIIIGIIIFILFISKKKPINNNAALMILQERYAKGEIDDEEYENKKNLLK